MRTKALVGLLTMLSCSVSDRVWSATPTEVLTVNGFASVSLYAPSGLPSAVVLFISGDGGWNRGVVAMAEVLRNQGALVAGIDIRPFMRTLEASDHCAYPAGALEDLARIIQLHRNMPEYKPPILVGYSSGATLVYAAAAAAPPETFAGAISLGFCPDLEIRCAICQQRGLVATRRTKSVGFDLAPNPHMGTPWMVLQGEVDQVCAPATTRAFVNAIAAARLFSLPNVGHGFAVTRNWEPVFLQAYKSILNRPATTVSEVAPEVHDLALTEVPVPTPGSSQVLG